MKDEEIKRLADYLQKSAEFAQRPWRLLIWNFLAGIARGFGIALGMTVVVAISVYFLAKLINLPIIGYWVAEIVKIVESYLRQPIPRIQ